MKRFLALVLAISCMFTICSCGGNKGKDVSGTSSNPSADSDKNSQADEDSQPNESKAKDVTYKIFDDFTRTQRVAAYDIYFDVPVYVESESCGFISHVSWDYAIVVASSRSTQTDLSVENDFADVMNDTYHGILLMYDDYKCKDYTQDTIGTVTLPRGAGSNQV